MGESDRLLGILSLHVGFVVDKYIEELLWTLLLSPDPYISLILIVAYVVYAKYEASRVISCRGCQVISFTAVAVKYLLITILLFTGSYFLVNPN